MTKAMVLAAGLGTRLGEMTKTRPKCLVEVGGKTMLERVIERLKAAGIEHVVINVHHLADQIEDFVAARGNFGIRIDLSKEESLLDTGGGLRKAEPLLAGGEPILVHNADVYCEMDLGELIRAHDGSGAIATLAVMERETSRFLLFDAGGGLCGWENPAKAQSDSVPGARAASRLAFSGIHVVSPGIFELMREEPPAFSIIRSYMKAARAGERVAGFRIDSEFWIDMGSPRKLAELAERIG